MTTHRIFFAAVLVLLARAIPAWSAEAPAPKTLAELVAKAKISDHRVTVT